jgi:hypothetical protein
VTGVPTLVEAADELTETELVALLTTKGYALLVEVR